MSVKGSITGLFAAIAIAWLAGCSSTPIGFAGPPGAVVFINGEPRHLPTSYELFRPAGVGQSNRYEIRLVFSGPQGEIHAKGEALVWGYTESDVDRVVVNTCTFNDSELANLAAGKTLVYKVQTASRQPLMDLTLAKE